jgi:hypothetical protein
MEAFRDPDMEEEVVLPLICFTEPSPKGSDSVQYILYPIGKWKLQTPVSRSVHRPQALWSHVQKVPVLKLDP